MVRRIVVIGGGVIGLSCARQLAGAGRQVTVLDGSTSSRESSWAAAGILGAGSEHAADGPLFRLCRDAFRDAPAALRDLEAETGVSLGRRVDGTLVIARSPEDATALGERDAFLRRHGVESRWLDAAAARAQEPRLEGPLLGALWIREGRLDNRALWQAFEASCRGRGVILRTGEAVSRVEDRGGRVVGVTTSARLEPAEVVVLAAGAWSDALAATADLPLPLVAVKGQMVRLAGPDDFLRHVVKASLNYAVPHRGGQIVVGTTAETVGFDRTLDETVLAKLVQDISVWVPGLSSLPRAEAWCGFRPRLEDGLPAIGAVEGRPGLFVATGHYRNGILLADLTGRLVATAVAGGRDDRLAAFSPDRFARPS